jgi:hypothetical protein
MMIDVYSIVDCAAPTQLGPRPGATLGQVRFTSTNIVSHGDTRSPGCHKLPSSDKRSRLNAQYAPLRHSPVDAYQNELGLSPQSPTPGFGEKCWNLSAFPSHSLESGGGDFLIVMFGQIFAYSAFSDSHFSSPGSSSDLIASTGHSGTHTPQSMHSSGSMTSMFSPS